MKCEYCNGTLTLEDKFCPNCGRPNTQAQQHIADMERYHAEFEDTKREVQKKGNWIKGLLLRLGILFGLLVAMVVIMVSSAGSGSAYRRKLAKTANKNYSVYSVVMDAYLEEGDFLSFADFVSEKIGSLFDTKYYEKYYDIYNSARNYQYVVTDVLNAAKPDSEKSSVQTLADSMKNFYRYYKDEDQIYSKYSGNVEGFKKYTNAMETQLEDFLITYFGCTREEAQSLPNLSEPRRAVLLEDKWMEVRGIEQE